MKRWTSNVSWSCLALRGWRATSSARIPLLNIFFGLMAIFIFGATFRAGIDRGMDQLVSQEGYGRVLNAIAAVMTEQRFGQGGYALSNCVHEGLSRRGFTTDPNVAKQPGIGIPGNLHSALFLDRMLQDMQRDLPKLSDYCGLGDQVRGLGGDDVGYVDFAKIAFFLFGLQIRALYYLFFLIYGLTLLCALIERNSDRLGQVILLTVAGMIYVSCYYSDFLVIPEPAGSGNMLNPRFIPVLAVIPSIHILIMLVDKAAPSWRRIAIVVFQSGAIFFAIHMRVSAIWWAPAIFAAAAALFLLSLKGKSRGGDSWRVSIRRGLTAQWPALIVLVVVFGGLKLVGWSLHPAYRQGGWVSYHTVWHAIYYSLQLHPQYVEKYGAYHEGKTGDEMPQAGALAYLKRHPEEDKPELFFAGTRSLRYAALERLDRLAFIEFAQRDPWFVVETFAMVKGKMIWATLIDAIKAEWSNAGGRAKLLLGVAVIIIASIAAGHPARFQNLTRLGAAAAIGAIVSLTIPVLTIIAPQIMTEQIMAIEIATILLVSLMTACVMRYVMRAAIYLAISKETSGHLPADYPEIQWPQPRFQNA
jgi:multisubunit Na+/H+ antiporter MnhG subunit